MEQIGYSLIDEKDQEVEGWGTTPGQVSVVPSPIRLPNGDDVHCAKVGDTIGGPREERRSLGSNEDGVEQFETVIVQNPTYRLVERWLAAAEAPSTVFDGEKIIEYRVLPPRKVRKSTIISRLTDDQLTKAIGMLSVRQAERWRAPDQPAINENDPEVRAIIAAVGADPAVILAPE